MEIDDATLQRLRQLLAPDFNRRQQTRVLTSARFPGNVGDGTRVRYKALAAASGGAADVWWTFTYDAATAYWYATGPPISKFVPTGDTTASLTYVALGTVQEITLPFAGDYYTSLAANVNSNTAGDGCLASYAAGSTAASDAWAVGTYTGGTTFNGISGRPYYLHTGLLAADKIAFQARAVTGGTATVANRLLNVLPLRCR